MAESEYLVGSPYLFEAVPPDRRAITPPAPPLNVLQHDIRYRLSDVGRFVVGLHALAHSPRNAGSVTVPCETFLPSEQRPPEQRHDAPSIMRRTRPWLHEIFRIFHDAPSVRDALEQTLDHRFDVARVFQVTDSDADIVLVPVCDLRRSNQSGFLRRPVWLIAGPDVQRAVQVNEYAGPHIDLAVPIVNAAGSAGWLFSPNAYAAVIARNRPFGLTNFTDRSSGRYWLAIVRAEHFDVYVFDVLEEAEARRLVRRTSGTEEELRFGCDWAPTEMVEQALKLGAYSPFGA